MEDVLKDYFKNTNLDIRKKPAGYSRFMDQKVTPDVVTFIADCIVNFLGANSSKTSFTVSDIWTFPYFIKNAIAVFGKPSPENETTNSEYNKFISQPLKTLAFSKVLSETKSGNKNYYTVLKPDIVEYISQNERNAWDFLVSYIEKVLLDSGFIGKFDSFKEKALTNNLKTEDFEKLKTEFQAFMRGYTKINGDTEINRIFPKILNLYSSHYQIPGTEKGHLTESRFIFPDLMYNRENFRDVGKDKTQSRQESTVKDTKPPEFIAYKVQKAKNIIRRHHPSSEVRDSLSAGSATQVHHIFPEHQFPEISDYVENLILLTPQQHYTRAHLDNKTQTISLEYQKVCLLSKIDSIVASINRGDSLYSKDRFIHVVNIGYGLKLSTTTSLEEVRENIKLK